MCFCVADLDECPLGCKLIAMTTPFPIDFDLWDEDGLLVEQKPELFVDLSQIPIIFSIRGIKYFKPRFEQIGVSLSNLKTKDEFDSAYKAWLAREWILLNDQIDAKAKGTTSANPHQVLQAVLAGDIDLAERQLARLEHKQRAGLVAVRDAREKDSNAQ